MTASALADALGVSEDTVFNWRKRRGGSRPQLELLPRIAQILGMGGDLEGDRQANYLLTEMGLLPRPSGIDPYETAYRIQKLDLRYREALERSAQGGAAGGVTAVVHAVRESAEWAVAIWPAFEGPPACRMHVSDRIDLRRFDGASLSNTSVFNHPDLHHALREAYAVPSGRQPRWAGSEHDPSVSSWSISHIGAPSSPRRQAAHPGIPSVHCFALTVESWVNDVASLLATSLGYGQTTTRDLAMEVTGVTAHSTSPESRNAAQRSLLARPPLRRVWSHHAVPAMDLDPFDTIRSDIPQIWLREDDELLEQHAHKSPLVSLDDLLRARERVDDLVRRQSRDVQVIETSSHLDSDERWLQVLQQVRHIYSWLEDQGAVAEDNRHAWVGAQARDPYVAGPMLAWLDQALSD